MVVYSSVKLVCSMAYILFLTFIAGDKIDDVSRCACKLMSDVVCGRWFIVICEGGSVKKMVGARRTFRMTARFN